MGSAREAGQDGMTYLVGSRALKVILEGGSSAPLGGMEGFRCSVGVPIKDAGGSRSTVLRGLLGQPCFEPQLSTVWVPE